MRKIFFTLSFLLTLSIYGQNNIEISLQQDARLLLFGDKKGNDALTVNLLTKLALPVYNFENSYLLTYLSVEYADLVEKNYKRYSLGAGYAIKSIFGKIGATAYADFGKIYRQKDGFFSVGFSGELSYKITERLKVICTQQFTYRKDLKVLYNSKKEYVISGFIGLKYRL
ncbi:hypothetical protein JL193_12500 [Polaribacter batillariae]|uniref:Outer membrane protein beta-barrel domain-containing protein n=1 Tax=Polaribacter batillariae TaxID=2808900 RepID=A0ABX7SRQ4_9FLAO|nr:hypothetical protein [Polaribacter batillariae]QTD36940.1 hypothetical protein JL193_12500 [Polaribacter batillariae]